MREMSEEYLDALEEQIKPSPRVAIAFCPDDVVSEGSRDVKRTRQHVYTTFKALKDTMSLGQSCCKRNCVEVRHSAWSTI